MYAVKKTVGLWSVLAVLITLVTSAAFDIFRKAQADVTSARSSDVMSGDVTPVVDAHFHMWDLGRFDYWWPRPVEEKAIYKNLLAEDYLKERSETTIKYSVFVEVVETFGETRWALDVAREHDSIKGVVGYVDMTSSDLDARLREFGENPKFVGVRKILTEEGWLERDDVMEGMRTLARHNKTYDLLIKGRQQFESAKRFLDRAPSNLRIVLDHLGKPDAINGAEQAWYDDITIVARHPNLYCKLSGMVTEADLENWRSSDFKRHVNHVIREFGIDRVMFGSDWPVCKMAGADLSRVQGLLEELVADRTTEEKAKIFGQNAVDFYRLPV